MNSSNEGLLYEGMLPITISAIQHFSDDSEMVDVNQANENLLRANLVLNESPEVDEHDEISLELRRQDLKISLLLDLVGELLLQNNLIPAAQNVKLTSSNIECKIPENLDTSVLKDSLVGVELYISPSTPKPLKLFGTVNKMDLEKKIIDIHFSCLTQNVKDWLEKTIFKHHRRTIAQGLANKSARI